MNTQTKTASELFFSTDMPIPVVRERNGEQAWFSADLTCIVGTEAPVKLVVRHKGKDRPMQNEPGGPFSFSIDVEDIEELGEEDFIELIKSACLRSGVQVERVTIIFPQPEEVV